MPRDSNGNYSLPGGNPVVTGTVISSAGWAIPTMQDLANEITNSLSRNGAGGMLTGFKITDGAAASPGLAFTNEPTTGLFRLSSNNVGFSVAGVNRWAFSTTVFNLAALQLTLGVPAAGGPSILAGGAIATTGVGQSYAGAGISAVLMSSPGSSGGYQVHAGLNLYWSGGAWVTGTDGGSNGGAMISSQYNPGNLNFFTAANTGGLQQSITQTNLLTNNLRMTIGATGGVLVTGVGAGIVGLNVVGSNVAGAPPLLIQSNNSAYNIPMAVLRSSNGAGFMPLEFQYGGVTTGRIRSDYGGNMTYAAFGGGVQVFSVGGDPSGGGLTAMTINANGQTIMASPTAGVNLTVYSVAGSHSLAITDSANTGPYYAGYLGMPEVAPSGSSYTAQLSDRGKMIRPSTPMTITLNTSIYSAGDVIAFENFSGGNVIITCNTGSIYWIGTGVTGNRTLANYGRASARLTAGGNWTLAGINLT